MIKNGYDVSDSKNVADDLEEIQYTIKNGMIFKSIKLWIFFLAIIIISPARVSAQEIFHGIVVDSASFSPMPYVTVVVKRQARGTVTDDKGNFSIGATRDDTLVFSFVGYYSAQHPLADYEAGLVRLTEKKVILSNVTIRSKVINPYEGMFDDDNARIAARHTRFYQSKQKKEKQKLSWLREDNLQSATYVDVMIRKTELKEFLMKKYLLTEDQYYQVLARFNEKNASVMYYITEGELVTLVKNFFDVELRR